MTLLVSIAEGNNFTDENDHIVWSFSSSEKYIVQSLYAVINYRAYGNSRMMFVFEESDGRGRSRC